ncbi:hypothetical protein FRC08_005319, partial [Ceratobasidium sp. 394]
MISFQVTQASSRLPRVFTSPQILGLICSFSSVSNCARLSRTCKAVFKVSTAFVWGHVNSAQHLLLLLGGAQKFKSEGSSGIEKIVIGTASSPLDVYGTGARGRYFHVDGWKSLALRTEQRPLLPNLLSIVLQSPCHDHGSDQLLWIRTFISPSLHAIHVIPNSIDSPSCISLPVASAILDVVAKCCPRLFKLSLLPSRKVKPEEPQESNRLLELLWRRPYQDYFRALPTLVELTCTTIIFERAALQIIGALPQLRWLIVMHGGTILDFSPGTLSNESFPALRQLHLRGVCLHGATTILGIPPLMKRLTHIELKSVVEYVEGENEDETDKNILIITNLLSLLYHSPHLSSLDLDLDPTKSGYEPCDIGNQELMDMFSKLPLETVSLTGLHLGDWAKKDALKSVWPNVTSLRMRDQSAPPEVL